MNIFHAARHSAEYKHKTITKRLFYALHLAKRPSHRLALVINKTILFILNTNSKSKTEW